MTDRLNQFEELSKNPEWIKGDAEIWLLGSVEDILSLPIRDREVFYLTVTKVGITEKFIRTLRRAVLDMAATKTKEDREAREAAIEAAKAAEKEERASQPATRGAEPFAVRNLRICEYDDSTEEYYPLCNFTARVNADVLYDDGVQTERGMRITGVLGSGAPLPKISVLAKDFTDLAWVNEQWGIRPIINSGKGVRDRLRHAIQWLSTEAGVAQEQVYTHSGWREINGERVFLHGAGAVGATGITTEMPEGLSEIQLPDSTVDLVAAVRHSLDVLEVAPIAIAGSVLAMTYLAPLTDFAPADFILCLEGGSGSLKSSIASLGMNHFGNTWFYSHQPTDWMDTPAGLERKLFSAKNVLINIDDLRPAASQQEHRQMTSNFSRVVRSVGNQKGRTRATGNMELQKVFPPRATVMMTAEVGMAGRSANARLLKIDVGVGDVNFDKLVELQATPGLFGESMLGYVNYVSENWDELKTSVTEKIAEYSATNYTDGMHRRLPRSSAMLTTGFRTMLDYALSIGAIESEKAEALFTQYTVAIGNAIDIQAETIQDEDSATVFMDALANMLAAGQVRVTAKNREEFSYGSALGERIGWHDGNNIYLLQQALTSTCKLLAAQNKFFPADAATLRKDLSRAGLLTKTAGSRLDTPQRDENGEVIRVTAISLQGLLDRVTSFGASVPGASYREAYNADVESLSRDAQEAWEKVKAVERERAKAENPKPNIEGEEQRPDPGSSDADIPF